MNAFFYEGRLVVSPVNAEEIGKLIRFTAGKTVTEVNRNIVINIHSLVDSLLSPPTVGSGESEEEVPPIEKVDNQPPERSKREELADLCREAGATEDQIKGKRATGLAKLLEGLKTPKVEEEAAPEESAEPETVYVSDKDLLAVIQAYVGPKESAGWAERRQKVKGMFPEGKTSLSKFEPEDRQALFDQVSKLKPEAEEWE